MSMGYFHHWSKYYYTFTNLKNIFWTFFMIITWVQENEPISNHVIIQLGLWSLLVTYLQSHLSFVPMYHKISKEVWKMFRMNYQWKLSVSYLSCSMVVRQISRFSTPLQLSFLYLPSKGMGDIVFVLVHVGVGIPILFWAITSNLISVFQWSLSCALLITSAGAFWYFEYVSKLYFFSCFHENIFYLVSIRVGFVFVT